MQLEDSDDEQQQTIENLINEISFSSKKQKDSTTKSVSGSSVNDSFFDIKQKKQRSKAWTQQENLLFFQLLQQYGTDFTLIKQFFPKKSKNQIKKKYKSQAKLINLKALPFYQPVIKPPQTYFKAPQKFEFSNILGDKFVMIQEQHENIIQKDEKKEENLQK